VKVALCLVVKNEKTEIIYWLAWHKALGFDTFIIYDDFSDDETENVILSLRSCTDIRYMRNAINHDLHNIRQVRAYNDALTKYGKDFDWIALFDADEYLDLYGVDIKTYLSAFDTASLIAFNWCNAGTNGHVNRPEGPPFVNYQNHGHNDLFWNRHTKVMFRPKAVSGTIYQVHNVPVHGESMDSEGLPIRWDGPSGGFTENFPTWKGARLIHYQSRSIEHYVNRHKNLEDVRRDSGDPLHTVAKGEEYNSISTPIAAITLNKFHEQMSRFASQQSLVVLKALRASSPSFIVELLHILAPAAVPIFQPAYVPFQHELDSNWISTDSELGNLLKEEASGGQNAIAFTIQNAFGRRIGSQEGHLCLSDGPEDQIIGIYFPGNTCVHLFAQDKKGLRVQGDARVLPVLTYRVWGRGGRTVFLSHPRTGRFLGFTPEGDYSIRKIRALNWEQFQFEPFDLLDAPEHVQVAANWLGSVDSLQTLRMAPCTPQDSSLAINAITALDDVSRRAVEVVSRGILGEHLL